MRGIRLDSGEAARLAHDCRRVADAIDEHVALLRAGGYGGVRGRGGTGYRPAVDAVTARLEGRAIELRAAARGLTACSSTIAAADGAAARRISGLSARMGGVAP